MPFSQMPLAAQLAGEKRRETSFDCLPTTLCWSFDHRNKDSRFSYTKQTSSDSLIKYLKSLVN